MASPTMLYDPTFITWRSFGVTVNSQMQLMTADLAAGSDLFFGFGDDRQAEILDAVDDFNRQ